MLSRSILFTVLIFSSCFGIAADGPLVVPSTLKTVTVYRSGAEMVHNSSVQLGAGNHDLLIENISNAVDINSIQINCASAVTIMGVEFSNNFMVTVWGAI